MRAKTKTKKINEFYSYATGIEPKVAQTAFFFVNKHKESIFTDSHILLKMHSFLVGYGYKPNYKPTLDTNGFIRFV